MSSAEIAAKVTALASTADYLLPSAVLSEGYLDTDPYSSGWPNQAVFPTARTTGFEPATSGSTGQQF